MQFKGFVAAISERPVKSKFKNGKSKAYSFKLENDDGSEGEWIGFGFDEPPFKEGDYIEVEAEENEQGYLNYVKGTGKQVKNPPARTTAKPSTARNGTAHSVAGNGTNAEQTTDTTVADRQTQIVLQHSQEMAINAVSALLEHDGLPMTKASTAAATAKRYDEIMAFVDKLTRKFYDDVVTGQLLKIVAPELISTEPDAPLPEPPAEAPKGRAKKVTVGTGDSQSEPGVF